MQSFGISFAKNLNRHLRRRRGAVLADRYHLQKLETPTQVRAALAYVLGNWRRDRADNAPGPIIPIAALPFPDDGPLPIRSPTCWLLKHGWRRHGLLSPWHRPGPAA